ncbi:hypothetical protein V6O07_20970, partial [Arthrospira platensis SPKY2]
RIDLQESCAAPQKVPNDSAFGNRIEMRVPAPETGDFFLHIRNRQQADGRDTEYTLSVIAQCSVDYYESNAADNQCNQARTIRPGDPVLPRSFCAPEDEDWV